MFLLECTGLHEKYQNCSNECHATCENYKNPPICTMQCSTALAGCFCEHPHVRHKNGSCVLTSQCKPCIAKGNSIYVTVLAVRNHRNMDNSWLISNINVFSKSR